MCQYQICMIRSGRSSLVYNKSYASDRGAIREARQLEKDVTRLEVWHGDICILSEDPARPLSGASRI